MLIEIDPDIIVQLESDNLSSRHVHAIENIIRSHIEGKHLVVINSLNPKFKLRALSSLSREGLHKIYFESFQFLELKKNIKFHIKVGISTGYNNLMQQEGGRYIKLVHLDLMIDSNSTQKSILLGEHDSDADIYHKIGYALATKKFSNGRLAMELQGGGGDSTGDRFAGLIQENRIVLCIADSDRKSPSTSTGNTAKRIERVPKTILQDSIILHCRNIENFTFWFLFQHSDHPRLDPRLSKYFTALHPSNCDSDFWLYAPFKEGLNCCQLRKYKDIHPRDYDYIYESMQTYFPDCVPIISIASSKCKNEDTCHNILIEPLGRFGIQLLQQLRPDTLGTTLHSSECPGFIADIAESVFAYGCSLHPRFAF